MVFPGAASPVTCNSDDVLVLGVSGGVVVDFFIHYAVDRVDLSSVLSSWYQGYWYDTLRNETKQKQKHRAQYYLRGQECYEVSFTNLRASNRDPDACLTRYWYVDLHSIRSI
jgi:hypothetical protein